MRKYKRKITKVVEPAEKLKRRLIENVDFTWAGTRNDCPVPLFTWGELNEILKGNNWKVPENMWKERLERKK